MLKEEKDKESIDEMFTETVTEILANRNYKEYLEVFDSYFFFSFHVFMLFLTAFPPYLYLLSLVELVLDHLLST